MRIFRVEFACVRQEYRSREDSSVMPVQSAPARQGATALACTRLRRGEANADSFCLVAIDLMCLVPSVCGMVDERRVGVYNSLGWDATEFSGAEHGARRGRGGRWRLRALSDNTHSMAVTKVHVDKSLRPHILVDEHTCIRDRM